MNMPCKRGAHHGVAATCIAVAVLALLTPFTPIVAGVVEVALFDTHLAAEWLRTTAVEETIAAYYRALGWPY